MGAVRIDVGTVWNVTDKITVNYGGAGDVTFSIRTVSNQVARHAADIKAHIHERLQAVNAALSCTESDGQFTIASSGSTFNIQILSASLAALLGMTTAAYTGRSSLSGSGPVTYIGHRPAIVTSGTRWYVRRTNVHRGRGRSVLILKKRFWDIDLVIQNPAEGTHESQFGDIAHRMLQGQPFSIFQDQDDMATQWAYTAPTKNLIGLRLDMGEAVFSYEPSGTPFSSEYAVSFTCAEYA